MKKFNIPTFYRSEIISKIKNVRKQNDPRKKDFTPTTINFGPVEFYIARHFGFCYGVENAIEIAYQALEENKDKKIYLLSQMIHNQAVNHDLTSNGVRFIMDTLGNQLIEWSEIKAEDIVIIPAFGTTIEIEERLFNIGVEIKKYNTTCPFVVKVWNRAEKLGKEGYTIIIHGKHNHEETRATFSHSDENSPALVVKNIEETEFLASYILGDKTEDEFFSFFENRCSKDFNPTKDLLKIGVVNQTTMLAYETQEIANFMKETMRKKYGEGNLSHHFADTRDTLCYATNDNQQATYALLEKDADLAIVVGGYNSSNTSHIVQLCEEKFPTYFINSEQEIMDDWGIQHFNFDRNILEKTAHFIPRKEKVKIALTSGASCPDAIVERVMLKILEHFNSTTAIDEALEQAIEAI